MKTLSLFIRCFFVSSLTAPTAFATESFIVSGNPKAPPVVWEQYEKEKIGKLPMEDREELPAAAE